MPGAATPAACPPLRPDPLRTRPDRHERRAGPLSPAKASARTREASPRGQLWHQVDCHLRAEHVHDLALARAQTLTYAALRDLADHAHDAGVAVWLLIAAERPTAAIAQLLEARPHQTADLQQLIDRWWQAQPPSERALRAPAEPGHEYPWLQPRPAGPLTPHASASRLAGPERAVVTHTWQAISDWMTDGSRTPRLHHGELARSIYSLVRRYRL